MEWLYGEIGKNAYNIEFVPLDSEYYKETAMDISSIYDNDRLIAEIKNMLLDEDSGYRLLLVGKRNFNIETDEILKFVPENILKIKDETESIYDFDQLAQENSLRGYFVKEMQARIQQADGEQKDKLKKALDLGMEILE